VTRSRPFVQVDVFGEAALLGNPLAVVLDGEGLDTGEMQAFARWTNLSETTFLLPPSAPDAADYRVRIFTPGGELPFAGHPTLGSAHAWRAAGGAPARGGVLVQECGVGLVELREEDGGRLAFAGPPTTVSPLAPGTVAAATAALGIDPARVQAAALLDNGPHWTTLLLDSADAVLGLAPDMAALAEVAEEVGVVGLHAGDGPADVEVRGFAPAIGIPEDPATGSLNAAVAAWLVGEGTLPATYVAAQGTAIDRAARIHLSTDAAGTTWVAGATRTVVSGTVVL
jgi:PhzF family phenazine biosynthesis protein